MLALLAIKAKALGCFYPAMPVFCPLALRLTVAAEAAQSKPPSIRDNISSIGQTLYNGSIIQGL
jgi:hypothetical protein